MVRAPQIDPRAERFAELIATWLSGSMGFETMVDLLTLSKGCGMCWPIAYRDLSAFATERFNGKELS